jgi:hypothetical protein
MTNRMTSDESRRVGAEDAGRRMAEVVAMSDESPPEMDPVSIRIAMAPTLRPDLLMTDRGESQLRILVPPDIARPLAAPSRGFSFPPSTERSPKRSTNRQRT